MIASIASGEARADKAPPKKAAALRSGKGIRPNPPSLTDSKRKSSPLKQTWQVVDPLRKSHRPSVPVAPEKSWSVRAVSCVAGLHIFAGRKCGVGPLELGARVCLLHTGVLLPPIFDTRLREVGAEALTAHRNSSAVLVFIKLLRLDRCAQKRQSRHASRPVPRYAFRPAIQVQSLMRSRRRTPWCSP